jgi:23S rRNA (uracil1939-C5)-methyltransferase
VPTRPNRGDEADVVIESLATGGRGVARMDGYVVFVDRALPGDRVRVRIRNAKRRFGEAEVVDLLAPGPDRIDPPCPYVGACGGCRWQALAYPAQVREKEQQVRDALARIAHLPDVPVADLIGAERTFGYRNKVEFTFSEADGAARLGFHRAGRWDEVLPVDRCLLVEDPVNATKDAVERWAAMTDLRAYHQRLHEGELRNLVVRYSQRTGQVLAVLVTTDTDLPLRANLIDELQEAVPGLVGVLQARNAGVAETSAGHPTELLHGRDWFEEEVLGQTLRVPWNGFLQTNTEMCETLYRIAIEEAGLRGDEVVWDLYSGIGSIGLALARDAGRVIGVEVVPEAVEQATVNALMNGIDNAEFVVGDVGRTLAPLREDGVPAPGVVVIDPPRAGLHPRAVRGVIELAPARIVYVSCNPTTMAGNAQAFVEAGYRLEIVRPVDMFPHTPHVECVARFEREEGIPVLPAAPA